MKEIRIHGRGGMGAVKAAEALVYAAVMDGKYGNSIPFFGFERRERRSQPLSESAKNPSGQKQGVPSGHYHRAGSYDHERGQRV